MTKTTQLVGKAKKRAESDGRAWAMALDQRLSLKLTPTELFELLAQYPSFTLKVKWADRVSGYIHVSKV